MKVYRPSIITIHSFALLHALCAAICRLAGFNDEFVLTLLTITMLLVLCAQGKMKVTISSCATVLGNLAGYIMGLGIAQIMSLMNIPPILAASIATLLTTELLGWAVVLIVGNMEKNTGEVRRREIAWMMLTCALVYVLRITLSICQERGMFDRIATNEGIFYILLSFCTMTILVSISLTAYGISEKRRTDHEKEKRHLAQFRYLRLAQQLNPHFLFNSLNVLDCIIMDGEDNERARDYLHKLSSIYRYMLSFEDEITVNLREEMDFVNQYMDLMKVRFPYGLEMETDISEEALNRSVVPCSVQLLIENATKHNAINKNKPLKITVNCPDGKHICVSNNICPKLTPAQSTGKGLKYLRQQYKDLSGQDIMINSDGRSYSVELPLL